MTSNLRQVRELHTEIPGPASRELQQRREAAVSSGVGSVMPVYVADAGGGVVIDVDGNSLIDLGSGIAVTSVGNSARGRCRCRSRAGHPLHSHVFLGHPV